MCTYDMLQIIYILHKMINDLSYTTTDDTGVIKLGPAKFNH